MLEITGGFTVDSDGNNIPEEQFREMYLSGKIKPTEWAPPVEQRYKPGVYRMSPSATIDLPGFTLDNAPHDGIIKIKQFCPVRGAANGRYVSTFEGQFIYHPDEDLSNVIEPI